MTVIKDSQLSSNSDIGTTIGEFNFLVSETATGSCYITKAFLEILQNSQENTCTRASFLKFSCEIWKIYKSTFSYRTSPVAVSGFSKISTNKHCFRYRYHIFMYFRLLLLDILKTLTTEEFIRYQVLFYFQQPENDRISCKYYCQAVARRCSAKKCVLKIPQNSQENIYTGIPLLIKFQASNLHKFIKLLQCCTENQLNFLVNWSKSCADLFTFIY